MFLNAMQHYFFSAMTGAEITKLIMSICLLPAGLSVFLLGMKMLGDGLERGAGKAIKKLFARIGENRFAAVGIGAGTTAVIQSSAATTVMVVGFVNAGVMTLFQATAVIMGANIGTTVTAFLGLIGDLPVASFFMASGVVGVFMYMFGKKNKVKCAGEIITGLAIIFVGIELMGNAFKQNEMLTNAATDLFTRLANFPGGPLLLVAVGAAFTAIIQSSSATSLMMVDLVGRGIMPIPAALFIILGANIGTCITALLASIGTSRNARRAALIHLMFNVIGAVVFIPIIWVLQSQVEGLLAAAFPLAEGASAETVKLMLGLRVACFHTFFNVTTTLVLLAFIRPLVKFATKMIPNRVGEETDEPQLYYIDEKQLSATAELNEKTANPESVAALFKPALMETVNMARLARDNIDAAFHATLGPDDAQKEKIVATEQKINFINRGIGRFLVRFDKEPLTEAEQKRARALHHVVSDIERIGDHAIDLLDEASEMKEHEIKFSPDALAELEAMYEKVSDMFKRATEIYEAGDALRLPEVAALEKEVDEAKHSAGFHHIERLNAGACSVEGGSHFYAIITTLERVADHLTNIAFSVNSTTGAQLETLKQQSKENQRNRASKKNIYW